MSTSLEKLHDIYVPESIGFEFLLGHMLLSVFLLSCLISLVYLFISYTLATRFKRTALKELKLYQKNGDISAVFDLIKRVLLTSNPRKKVAKLSGTELIAFMGVDKQVLKVNSSLYNSSIELSEDDQAIFYKEVEYWIKKQGALYD